MSNEQRAALEQRLAQLRAAQQQQQQQQGQQGQQGQRQQPSAMAGAGQGTGSSYHPSTGYTPATAAGGLAAHQGQQPHVPQGGRPAPQMGYGYDEDDEEEEDEEDAFDLGRQQFEEEFLRMLAAQQRSSQQQQQPHHQQARPLAQHERNAASVAQVNATRHADDGVDVVATDKTAQRSRELGDFEALRLAKMGDAASMLDFGTACGVDWRTFVDNRGRNALHYVADAGAADLIRRLSDDLRVPYVADEQQLTPLDVAVLNGHADVETDEVFAALVAAATAARHADAKLADPKTQKTLESVLQAHAPAPPKFVMSKPVPKPADGSAKRSFWSPAAAAAPSSASSSAVQCSSGAELTTDEAAAVTAAVNALDHHGRLEWLLPVTREAEAPCQRWQIARTFSSADSTHATAATTTGIVVAQVLANVALKGSAAQKVTKGGDSAVKVAVAAHLGVQGSARRAGVAASLLKALRTRLSDELGTTAASPANGIVFFAAGAPLPRPPSPLATVKWYRRVFDAVGVYAADSAYDVFPDFYNYDTILRADAVLKGAIPASLYKTYEAELPAWCAVDVASEDQCGLIVNFLCAKVGTAESNVDLACVPQDVAELRRSILDHPDQRAYVRTNAQGALTDFVVFRRRDARKQTNSSSTSDTFAAEVAYAVFTSISGTAKADHMMLLASQLLSAKMLLVPTMFGLTESDLAKANFDEVVASRESIYAVAASSLKDVEGLGPIPAARLSLPLYTI